MCDDLKELSKGASTHASLANKLWVAMALLALMAVLAPVQDTPPAPAGVVPDGTNSAHTVSISAPPPHTVRTKALPFNLGAVPEDWFYYCLCLLLSVFCMAFCSAHTQSIRTQKLIHKELEKAAATYDPKADRVHPRDLYDATVRPSLNRVAPLAQVLRGRYQFHPDADNCPPWRRNASGAVYAFFKLLATTVYYLLPAAALLAGTLQAWHTLPALMPRVEQAIIVVFVAGSSLSLIIIVGVEMMFACKALTSIMNLPKKAPGSPRKHRKD